MSFTVVGGAVVGSVASGVVGSIMSPDGRSSAPAPTTQGAAAAADPFASQRGQYQDALKELMTKGSSAVGADPSYQFRFQQGEQALERSAAGMGMFGSGNMGMALVDYGQKSASTEFAAQWARLAQLAGGNIGSPGTAGQIIGGAAASNQQGINAFGSQIGKAATDAWGNWKGGDNTAAAVPGADYGFVGAGIPDMSAPSTSAPMIGMT